ncbi:hypothetical protein BDD12DRAFT_737213, partial [Trichophaea hybrida]
IRRYATPAGEEKKSSSTLLYTLVVLAGAGAGAGYYFYTAETPLPPAIPTLTGDGKWVDLKLAKIEQISPNTKRLRFKLPSEDHVSGLKIASALLTKYKGPKDEKPTIRPYTPVSDENQRGYMDLIIKKYEGGPMSTHIHDMNVDQMLAFKGPLPKYEWAPNKHEHITLIAGGTGITPIYQLIRAIFSNPEDKTKVTLVFGNVTEDDILLKQELAHLENTYPQRFKASYVLDNAPKDAGWATQGRVTKELLKTVLPEPGKGNNKIFVCGPPGMYKAISGTKKSPSDQGEIAGILKELGYTKEEVYKF